MADQNMASGSTGNAAILLIGPTGSGKTPLGQLIEHRGLGSPRCFGVETKRCLHFDFGANLREAVARGEPDGVLLQKDIDFLARVLAEGLLLEDEHFPVAARILQSFLKRHKADRQTVVVLNGLPRHISQAQAVAALLDVRGVVHLQCSAEVVRRRIESNVGGDRARRVDDARQAVEAKLTVFQRRTVPLLEHYRWAGVPVVDVEVSSEMTPEVVWDSLCHVLAANSLSDGFLCRRRGL